MDIKEKRKKVQDLRDKRSKIIEDQRKMWNLLDSEDRDFTSEEEEKFQKMEKDYDSLTDEIKKLSDEVRSEEEKEERGKRLIERELELSKSINKDSIKLDLDNPGDKDKRNISIAEYQIRDIYKSVMTAFRRVCGTKRSTEEYINAYRNYLLHSYVNLSSEDKRILALVDSEVRALQADNDTAGGFLVVPEQMVYSIIEELDNRVFVRQYASIYRVPNAASFGAPARDTDIGDLEWTSEIRTGSEDSDLDFNKRKLTPHALARRIKASRKLIRISAVDIAAYIADRFAYKMSVVEENAFLNGDGVNKPLGVFTASDSGISTARDVSTGNTTTAITGDGLYETLYTLPKQYRTLPSNRWCFHRDAIKKIRKLKDGEGQYLWSQGLGTEPDRILGLPFEESEYAPNTFTTGLYVGILGDWNQYWIVDSLGFEIQVLTELYAETEQVGYICRKETDGMPVLEAAFVRVKLA